MGRYAGPRGYSNLNVCPTPYSPALSRMALPRAV